MDGEAQDITLLQGMTDDYGDVKVNLTEPMTTEDFVSKLKASLEAWRNQGKKRIWIKLADGLENLIAPAKAEGFEYHHAERDYLMLVSWISDLPSTLPTNASHRIGIGVVSMNRECILKQNSWFKMLRSLKFRLFSLASSSTCSNGFTPPQDKVFVNFRGDELRNSFVSFLVKAMRLEKINAFIDEAEVRGTHLNNLFNRIEETRVAVPIFSERYTQSCWCLDELVKMKEQMDKGKLVVLPVFYKLDATACKRLMGAFGDNFRKLEWDYRSEPERIKKWKEALSSVCNNFGLTSDKRSDESKFVDLIVEEVKRVLIKISTTEREP